MFRLYLEIYKKNIKIFLLPAVFSVIFLTVVLFFITDPINCTAAYAARICQEYFTWVGIFLLAPVFMPEQRDNIKETILSKTMPTQTMYLIRLIQALAALVLFTAGLILSLSLLGGEIEFKRYFVHTFAIALLLGGLGFMGTRFSGNIGVGYIIAFGFYIIQMFLPDEIIEIVPYIYIFTLKNETSGIFLFYIYSFILIIIPFFKKH